MRAPAASTFSRSIRRQPLGHRRDQKSLARADDQSQEQVTQKLLSYLEQRFDTKLGYSQEPVPVTDGWETFIYHFKLQKNRALPMAWRQPLTLRLYAGPEGIPRGSHEFQVQQHLYELRYAVPAAIHWEESCTALGGPFTIMEHVFGPMVFQVMLYRPLRAIALAGHMAAMQAKLHRLSARRFPGGSKNLLERSLQAMAERIDEHGLQHLQPGLKWLRNHRPAKPRTPRILHLDYHPLNLIQTKDRGVVVIDWAFADVGDPHADVASTLMLIACAPNLGKNCWEQMVMRRGRWLLGRIYENAYRRERELDDAKLTYYRAWAALRRLIFYERWRHDGPGVTGAKAVSIHHLRPEYLDSLARYFEEMSGVALAQPKGERGA
jgi:aminoglycoside phosphotransferase (APT) family kinase protein